MHTATSIRTYRKCPRLYKYEYVDLYRPAKTPKAILIGEAFHLGCELFWSKAKKPEMMEGLEQYFLAKKDAWSGNMRYEASRVRAMCSVYYDVWEKSRDAYQVLSVEHVFKADDFTGKVDVLLSDGTRRIVMEHKTTSMDVSGKADFYWERLAIDSQVTIYAMANDAESILYDVAVVSRHRPKTSKGEIVETPKEFETRLVHEMSSDVSKYFIRREVHRTRLQNEELMHEIECTIAGIENDDTYVRCDNACMSAGGACPFLGVCCGSDTLDGPNFVRTEKHPELESE